MRSEYYEEEQRRKLRLLASPQILAEDFGLVLRSSRKDAREEIWKINASERRPKHRTLLRDQEHLPNEPPQATPPPRTTQKLEKAKIDRVTRKKAVYSSYEGYNHATTCPEGFTTLHCTKYRAQLCRLEGCSTQTHRVQSSEFSLVKTRQADQESPHRAAPSERRHPEYAKTVLHGVVILKCTHTMLTNCPCTGYTPRILGRAVDFWGGFLMTWSM